MSAARILLLGANGQVGRALQFTLRNTAGKLNPKFPQPASDPSSEGRGASGFAPLPSGTAAIHGQELHGGAQRRVRVREGEIVAATRDGKLESGLQCERVDLSDLDGLHNALDRIAPDLIVNAAAYTAVDRAEDEPDLAMRVNAQAPGVLGYWAAKHEARVLHYSTDYVFSGRAQKPYREDDPTHPVSMYGRSKLAGELALRASGARHLILRTAWVYAPRGQNFLRTMLRLAKERDELRVVADQVGAPTPAEVIARVTAQIVPRWFNVDLGDSTAHSLDGVYHLTTTGQTSWNEFARAIFLRAQHKGLITRVPHVEAIKTIEYPTRARRPAYSVLDTSLLREIFEVELPDWQQGLDAVFEDLAG